MVEFSALLVESMGIEPMELLDILPMANVIPMPATARAHKRKIVGKIKSK